MARERNFHLLFRGGERIRRRLNETVVIPGSRSRVYRPSEQPSRVGTVTGPAQERSGSRGAWYVPVRWDGHPEDRVEWIHINRISLLEV